MLVGVWWRLMGRLGVEDGRMGLKGWDKYGEWSALLV
jgi:hypothetical protein